jgi:hypothetical protein
MMVPAMPVAPSQASRRLRDLRAAGELRPMACSDGGREVEIQGGTVHKQINSIP